MGSAFFTTKGEKRNKLRRAEECLAAAAAGDTEALEELYSLTQTDLYAFALTQTGVKSEAEEVLKESYIQIFRFAGHYCADGKPMQWLFGIAGNLIRRRIAIRREAAAVVYGLPAMRSSAEEVIDHPLLRKITENLREEEQEILALRLVSEMSYREIADLVGLSVAAVIAKFRRSARTVAGYLSEGEEADLAAAVRAAFAAETPHLREDIGRVCADEAQLPADTVENREAKRERSLLVRRSLVLFALVFLFLCGVCVGYFMPSGRTDREEEQACTVRYAEE